MATTQTAITKMGTGIQVGRLSSSATTRMTGHSKTAATVRHGTNRRFSGLRFAMIATATGSAKTVQRTAAEGTPLVGESKSRTKMIQIASMAT